MADQYIEFLNRDGQTVRLTVTNGALQTSGGGGGGGATTLADGADVAQGALADIPVDVAEDSTPRTGLSLWKGIKNYLRLLVAAVGIKTGTAVITDADGTVQQYLRGLATVLGQSVLQSTATFTRPNNTTQYAAGAAVMNSTTTPALIEFTNVNRANGLGVTIGAVKLCKSTNVITNANFRLWLYSAAPSPVPNDAAAFAQAWANRALRVGWVDFSNPIQGSDCVTYQGVLSMLGPDPIIPAARSIFGILQATSAYVPGAQEIFDFYIRGW